jgi:hypothetical protein
MTQNCKPTAYGERTEDLLPALLTIANAMTLGGDGSTAHRSLSTRSMACH